MVLNSFLSIFFFIDVILIEVLFIKRMLVFLCLGFMLCCGDYSVVWIWDCFVYRIKVVFVYGFVGDSV